MNSFFKQLLGAIVQIGINEISKKTNSKNPQSLRDSSFTKEPSEQQKTDLPPFEKGVSAKQTEDLRREVNTDDSGDNFDSRISRRGQQRQEVADSES